MNWLSLQQISHNTEYLHGVATLNIIPKYNTEGRFASPLVNPLHLHLQDGTYEITITFKRRVNCKDETAPY